MATKIRTAADVAACMEVLQQFRNHGFDPFPLKRYDSINATTNRPNGNTPRDKGWLTANYDRYDFADWMAIGGNIGFRLQANQLVMDVDPRNGGLEGLDALTWDMDANPILQVPYVVSGRGDGGSHYYFNKPPMLRTRVNLPGYHGIDFKRGPGAYVVAPGALHYKTGKPYELGHIPIDAITQAPDRLLQLIEHQVVEHQARGVDADITLPQLVRLLSCLDPASYGQGGEHHDQWLNIAMACHSASGGSDEGFEVFWAWCAQDDRYASDEVLVANRWRSFEAGRPDGYSYRTLLRHVVEAGYASEVAKLGGTGNASDDFIEDPVPDLDDEPIEDVR